MKGESFFKNACEKMKEEDMENLNKSLVMSFMSSFIWIPNGNLSQLMSAYV